MSRYVLSEDADDDILQILMSSIERWGLERAERYILELHVAFENLAAFPDIDMDVGHVRCGYLQFPHDSHTVFYKKSSDGILIVRVLHQRQSLERYL